MSTNFDYARQIEKTKNAAETTAACSQDMADALDGMSRSLSRLHLEMRRARAAGEQALAIQQQLLQQQQFQAFLEELIYNTDKMLTEYRDPHTSIPASTRYHYLVGLLKDIRDNGISTAVIQGRDNKAAFDRAQKEAMELLKKLNDHPEVREALAWEKEHRKRLEDQRKKDEEAERKQAEQAEAQRQRQAEADERQRQRQAESDAKAKQDRQSQITAIHQRIESLKAGKKRLDPIEWYKMQFSFLDKYEPPMLYVVHGAIWLFCGGILWIPGKYWLDASAADKQTYPEINGEIKALNEQLQSLKR